MTLPFAEIDWMAWQGWDWGAVLSWVWWIVLALIMITGFVGTFLPVLPGPLIIFVGAAIHQVLHYFWRDDLAPLSIWGCVALTLLLALSALVEFLSGAMGAKWFGSTRWGAIGALVGGVVGLFFGIPGLLLGPLIGVFAFEMLFAKQQWKPATKSTWGTLLGTGVGLAFKVAIAAVMVVWFYVDTLLF